MKINIQPINLILTPDISAYLEKKLNSLKKLVDEKDDSVFFDIELEKTTEHHKKGDIFRAEINVHIAGKRFTAESENESINAALDEMKDEIAKEIKNYKDKQKTSAKREGTIGKNMIKGLDEEI